MTPLPLNPKVLILINQTGDCFQEAVASNIDLQRHIKNKIMGKLIAMIVAGLVAFLSLFVIVLVIGAIIAFPIMWLWNGCLVGLVTGISPIHSAWQAFGLFILCGLLFKSFSCSSKK